MSVWDGLRWAHILSGAVALSVFWIPMIARKGGRLHRRVGWVFVAGMLAASVTGLVSAGHRLAEASHPRARLAGGFLMFIGVLTGAAAWKGVRVLRAKARTAAHRNPVDLGVAGLLGASGLAVAGLGLAYGAPLLAVFGVIGVVSGGSDLLYWLRPPREHMHWWFQHMADMIRTTVAALTAFLVVNAGRLGLPRFSLVTWLLPAAVLFPILVVWQRHYRRRFAGREAAAAARARPMEEVA